jgi:hypothetical protein
MSLSAANKAAERLIPLLSLARVFRKLYWHNFTAVHNQGFCTFLLKKVQKSASVAGRHDRLIRYD